MNSFGVDTPMLCKSVASVSQIPDADDYLIGPKLDGYRLLVYVGEAACKFYTRTLKCEDGKLPYLDVWLRRHFPPGTILDGEITALRSATPEEIDSGMPALINDFEHVQSIMNSDPDRAVKVAAATRPLTYHCFDIIKRGDEDLKDRPLTERLDILRGILRGVEQDQYFQLTPYVPCTQDRHDAWVHAGFEGSVSKKMDSVYEWGARTVAWFKIKAVHELDAVVVGFIPGKGKNYGQVGSLIFAQPTTDPKLLKASTAYIDKLRKQAAKALADGDTSEGVVIHEDVLAHWGYAVRGCCRGFDDALMAAMTADFESYVGRIIALTHNGRMASGLKVRHPQFQRLRTDKNQEEVTWHSR